MMDDLLVDALDEIREAADDKLAAEVRLERLIRAAVANRLPRTQIAKAAGISRSGLYKLLAE